jgi:hypothetical protein
MDDAKIDLIAREVLTSLKKARAEGHVSAPASSSPPRSTTAFDPSLQLLSVSGGVVGQPCVIEPDKVCVASLKCRSFGH